MGHPFFVSVNFNIKTNFKIIVKGNGRECPFHTCWASLRSAWLGGRSRQLFFVGLIAALKRCATQMRTAGSSRAFGALRNDKGFMTRIVG